ncbi:MAG: HAD-IIB family hydrolase, partial [Phormidesmis sp.]
MTEQIILTALEGMSLSVVDCAQLRPVLAQLRTKGVPVIAFTERYRAELEPIRHQLGWVEPFITESGSGIFTPVNHNPFELAPGEREGDYYVQA